MFVTNETSCHFNNFIGFDILSEGRHSPLHPRLDIRSGTIIVDGYSQLMGVLQILIETAPHKKILLLMHGLTCSVLREQVRNNSN